MYWDIDFNLVKIDPDLIENTQLTSDDDYVKTYTGTYKGRQIILERFFDSLMPNGKTAKFLAFNKIRASNAGLVPKVIGYYIKEGVVTKRPSFKENEPSGNDEYGVISIPFDGKPFSEIVASSGTSVEAGYKLVKLIFQMYYYLMVLHRKFRISLGAINNKYFSISPFDYPDTSERIKIVRFIDYDDYPSEIELIEYLDPDYEDEDENKIIIDLRFASDYTSLLGLYENINNPIVQSLVRVIYNLSANNDEYWKSIYKCRLISHAKIINVHDLFNRFYNDMIKWMSVDLGVSEYTLKQKTGILYNRYLGGNDINCSDLILPALTEQEYSELTIGDLILESGHDFDLYNVYYKDRHLALKYIYSGSSSKELKYERFVKDACMTSLVSLHGLAPRVLGHAEVDGGYTILTEFVPGVNLDDILRTGHSSMKRILYNVIIEVLNLNYEAGISLSIAGIDYIMITPELKPKILDFEFTENNGFIIDKVVGDLVDVFIIFTKYTSDLSESLRLKNLRDPETVRQFVSKDFLETKNKLWSFITK